MRSPAPASQRGRSRVGLALAVALATAASAPAVVLAKPAKIHDIPLPRGSRIHDRDTDDVFVSSRSFRRTVQFYRRFLKRKGLAHEEIPVYRYNGTVVARFLSRQKGARWSAIHVFQHRGRTLIAILPRPLTPADSQGKDSSP